MKRKIFLSLSGAAALALSVWPPGGWDGRAGTSAGSIRPLSRGPCAYRGDSRFSMPSARFFASSAVSMPAALAERSTSR